MSMYFPKNILLPQKTIIDKGAVSQLAYEIAEFGSPGLIVHGKSLEKSGRKEEIAKQFSGVVKPSFFCRQRKEEPVLQEITDIIEQAKVINAQWIVGLGGGSVLDLAKAAAGLFHAKERPVFYQEGGKLGEQGIPFVAVPTTAGTGSEVTKNSVIINPEKKVKLSIRDDSFIAQKIILDGELLVGLSPQVILYAGLDAYVQAYEAFISKNAAWYTDSFALQAITIIDKNIESAYNKQDVDSLFNMLIGSYCAGVAFAHARLGVIHGIAHPLGVLYGFTHGLICAVCWPLSLKINRGIMGEKYNEISKAIGIDFEERIEQLLSMGDIKSPFIGKEMSAKEKIMQATLNSGSTAANPKKIEANDVEFILKNIF